MKEHKQVILGSVGLVLVMAIMFFFLITPRKGDLAEAKDAVTAAESETVVLQTELTRLQGLQKNAPQLQAALDQIRELVPDDDNVSNFVFQTQQEADKAGLEFVSITPQLPKPPPEGAPLAEVKIDIGAKGTYFSIQDFIRRLTELDRAVRIDGFSMNAVVEEGSEETMIELTAVARVFFEQPVGGIVEPGAAVPVPVPSTEATPAPTETPTETPAP
jgi:Tfp pilus assembly protein PilO